MELPIAANDWLTIAVGIIGVAGGLLATLAGSWFQSRLERFRARSDAADAFISSHAGAVNAIEYAIDHPTEQQAFKDARHHVGVAAVPLGRIHLRFGPGPAADEAAASEHLLRQAVEALENDDGAAARQYMNESRRHATAFSDAAHVRGI